MAFWNKKRASQDDILSYQHGVILVQLTDGAIMSISSVRTGCCVTIFRLFKDEPMPVYLSDIPPLGKRGGWLVDELPAFVASVATKMCVTVGEVQNG